MKTAQSRLAREVREDEARTRSDNRDHADLDSATTRAAVLGQLAEGIIIADARGRIRLVNEAAAAIHGVARLDVEPENYSETYHLFTEAGEPYPPLELPLARAVRGEITLDARWRIRRPDGSEVFAVGNAQPLRAETGEQIGAVLTLRDETAREAAERALRDLNARLARVVEERTAEAERARAEAELAQAAAEHASAAKSDFLASMSHEIRTPLNGVVAMADMLARADLPEKERAMAEIIRASGDTLQRLLSDILDMARIESGKVTLECAPFHLGDTLRSVAGLSQLRCDEKGVQLRVDIGPEVDRVATGDMIRVRQIVTNLMSNAVKFTDQGEVRMTAERLPEGGIRVSVLDTGVGFAMSDKAKVLGRFEQADSSITRRFGGTGLGLSISRSLAELMDGELDCDSRPGIGSRFWVDLPLDLHQADQASSARPEAGAAAAPLALRVLVVDDHPTNRRIVQLMLDAGDTELTSAENGAEALKAFETSPFDLILMDMQMPVMDGLTALRRIRVREREQGMQPTPVIMLTANAMPDHMAAAIAAGADLHLAKPFTAADLFNAMTLALGGKPGAALRS